MHKVVGKLIFKAKMLQNLISFYFGNQKLCLKTKSLFWLDLRKKEIFNAHYFWQVYLPCNNLDDAIFLIFFYTF